MKEFEEDDPMELQAIMIPVENLDEQARFIMEEFLSMGTSKDRLMEIFKDPFYVGTHHLCQVLGEKRILELLQERFVTPTSRRQGRKPCRTY